MIEVQTIKKIVFAIIGRGWRSEFYLRIARECPERFEVCGLVTRSEARGREIEKSWGVKTFRTIEELLEICNPDFAIVSVTWEAAPVITKLLFKKNIPVLSETPPAPDVTGLLELNKLVQAGARIQVAEQYHLQPLHAARISLVNSGKLGNISQVQASLCHGYHGMSLIRRLMGINFENAVISGKSITSPLIDGPSRDGGPQGEKIVDSEQIIALMDFDGKLCIYDFTGDQYFSWIRSNRLLVRGNKGEINDSKVRYLKDFNTPIEYEFKRQNAGENGNLEGYYLKGIMAGEEWIYKNPLMPGRLTDDEIAVATCLIKMYKYVKTGVEFYSLAEASQDHYLSMMIDKAVATGEKIATETQPWAFNK